MIKKAMFFIKRAGLLTILVLASIIGYNEILYFTGWKDNVATPDNKAPIHFYVINLDRQPERFVKIKQQADKIGINLERISATDGYAITFVEHQTGKIFTGNDIKAGVGSFEQKNKYDVYCYPESFNNKEAPTFVYTPFENISRGLTIGELGLICSYRLLWKNIASDANDQIAVILEDDVILSDDFTQKFTHFIKALPQKWDVIYLRASLFHIRNNFVKGLRWKLGIPTLTINDYFIKIHDQTNVEGTYAYAINKESALKLVKGHDKDTSVPIDYTIARMIQNRAITAYIAKNKIVAHDDSMESEISNMGRKEFGN